MALVCKILVLLILALPLFAQAGESVMWLIYDTAPQIIHDGNLGGPGFGDLQQKFLADHLPEFEHHLLPASLERIGHDMAGKHNVCTINIIATPERRKNFVVSDRTLPMPGFRLMIREDRHADFEAYVDADGSIDLERLATANRLKGAYVTARRYPLPIEDFIKSPGRVAKLENFAEASQVFSLIEAERIDFAIVLAIEVPYFTLKFAAMPPTVRFPIKGIPARNNGYVLCSRGALGQKVITQINQLFSDDRHWADFMLPLQPWISSADLDAILASKRDRPTSMGAEN